VLDEPQGASLGQQLVGHGGVTGADGVGQGLDVGVGGEAVRPLQHDDRRIERAGPTVHVAAHDVGEHGARLDAGQLVRITDEHQTRSVGQGAEELRHQRQRHHRRLVHHHEVGVELRARSSSAGSEPEETVKRLRPQRVDEIVGARPRELVANGVAHASSRLAGRSGQRDARGRAASMAEGGEDPGQRPRLPRSRPTRDHGEGARQHHRGGLALQVGSALRGLEGEVLVEAITEVLAPVVDR